MYAVVGSTYPQNHRQGRPQGHRTAWAVAGLMALGLIGCERPQKRYAIECEDLVRLYSDLYIQHHQNQRHPAFDEVLAAAARIGERPEESCQVLIALKEEIERERAGMAMDLGIYADPEIDQLQVGWTGRRIVGVSIVVVGLAVALMANLWILGLAFQQSVLWGLAYIFLPLANLIYVSMHWERSRDPFLINLAGSGMVFLGLVSLF